MANRNDNNQRNNPDTIGGQLRSLGRELAGAIAGFAFQLSKIFVKGGFGLYRTLNQPEPDKQEQPEPTQQQHTQTRTNPLSGLLGRRGASSTAPTADDPATQAQQPSGKFKFVDDDSVQDREAASMLDDLLQETAQRLQSEPEPPASDLAADAPVEANTEPAAPAAAPVEPASPAPDLDALKAELDAPPEPKPITYDTPDEKVRIQEQLRQREERLKQEETVRKEVFEDKETEKASLQDAMKADMERIKREREAREARFRQAEAERKRRQAEAERDARLSDGAPDDTADDAEDGQGQMSSEG